MPLTFTASHDAASLALRSFFRGPTGAAGAGTTLYDTRTQAAAATIPTAATFTQTEGYAAVGDGGRALYIHASGSTTGGFQSADGQWWQLAAEGFVTPEQFGADGTAAGDTAGIQSATDTGKVVLFEAREYLLLETANANHGIVPTAAFTWIGAGIDKTILKTSAPTTWPSIHCTGVSNIYIFGITFDGNGQLPAWGTSSFYPNICPSMDIETTDRCTIEYCKFIGWTAAGIFVNDSTNVILRGNYSERTGGPSGVAANFGIFLFGQAPTPTFPYDNNIIENNTVIGSIISTTGRNFKICNNTVSNWGFSNAINCQLGDKDILIANNHLMGGGNLPADLFSTYPGGIEAWCEDSIIANNVAENCAGAGIGGGQRGLVIGNRCINNGQNTTAPYAGDRAGIALFGGDATHNADNCMVIGNVSGNTGANVTQLYGVYVGGNVAQTGIVVENNFLPNNTTLPVGIQSDATVFARNNYPRNTNFYLAAQFDKTNSTALANITGLVHTLGIGRYMFEATLHMTCDATGGAKVSVGGTASWSAFRAFGVLQNTNGSTYKDDVITTPGSTLVEAGAAVIMVQVWGTIVVTGAGTLAPQFAQFAANNTSSVLIGSTFVVTPLEP